MSVKELVIQERANNPNATLQQMGTKFGVSKQWVSQILMRERMATRHRLQSYICNNCGITFTPSHPTSNRFCSRKCFLEYSKATLECTACGTLFQVNYSDLIHKVVMMGQQNFYCSLECKGKGRSQKYRLKKYLENGHQDYKGSSQSQASKWATNLPKIVQKLEQGQSLRSSLRELGISTGSTRVIKKLLNKENFKERLLPEGKTCNYCVWQDYCQTNIHHLSEDGLCCWPVSKFYDKSNLDQGRSD